MSRRSVDIPTVTVRSRSRRSWKLPEVAVTLTLLCDQRHVNLLGRFLARWRSA